MQDINKLSFSITGSAASATSSLNALIQKLGTLDSVFSKASASGKSFVNTLNSINTVASSMGNSLSTVSTAGKTVNNTLNSVNVVMQQFNTQLKSTQTQVNNTSTQINTLNTGLDGVESNAKTASTGLKSLNNNIGKGKIASSGYNLNLKSMITHFARLSAVVIITRKAFQALHLGFTSAIGYVENLNLFMVALGENTTRATTFIQEMSDSLYLDEAQLTRVQGLFYQISESLGLSSEKAYTLSENFTKLAYDLSSFYNISVDDAIVKLQAGLVGETEPLRRLGIIITENNLAETAANLGIKKSIRSMTEAEKIQLRYVTALQQTKNAQGDMARTLKQPENLIRVWKQQMSVFAREMGNVFIPTLQLVAPYAIAATKALTKLAHAWALNSGYEMPEISDDLGGYSKVVANEAEDVDDSTSSIASNLKAALQYVRDMSTTTSGIDELNIVGDSDFTYDLENLFDISTVSDAVDTVDLALENYNNGMKDTNGIFEDLVDMFDERFEQIGEALSGVFDTTKTAWGRLRKSLTGDSDFEDGLTGVQSILKIINEITTGILNGLADVVDIIKDLYTTYLKPIVDTKTPDWFDSLTDGSLASVIELMTKMFIAWKAVKVGVNAISFLTKLTGLTSNTFGIKASTALFSAIGLAGVVDVLMDLGEVKVTGDWSGFTTRLASSLIAAIGVGILTHSIKAGALAFTLTSTLNLDFVAGAINFVGDVFDSIKKQLEDKKNKEAFDKWVEENGVTQGMFSDKLTPSGESDALDLSAQAIENNNKLSTMVADDVITVIETATAIKDGAVEVGKVMGQSAINSLELGINSLAGLFTLGQYGWSNSPRGSFSFNLDGVSQFANGGTPKKGSLFIAGEAGAELVGDLGNGGTSVVNQDQMKALGIPMYANGVNVPNKTSTGDDGEIHVTINLDNLQGQLDTIIGFMDDDYSVKLTTEGNNAAVVIDAIAIGFADLIDKGADAIDTGLDKMGVFGKALKFSGKLLSKTGKFVTGLPNTISSGLTTAYGAVKKAGDYLWEGVKDSVVSSGLISAFETVSKVVHAVSSTYKAAGKVVVSFYESFVGDKETAEIMSEDSSNGATQDQMNVMSGVVGSMLSGTLMGTVFDVMQSINDGVMGEFLEALPTYVQAGMQMIVSLIEGVATALPDLMAMIPDIITEMVGYLTNGDSLNKIINGLLDMVVAIVLALPDIMTALIAAIPTVINSLVNALISNAGEFAKVGVILGVSVVDGLINVIITGINSLIYLINKIPFVKIDYLKAVDFTSSVASAMGYAEGGFPTDGEVFIAREAGAEMVGSMNGSTAVANNDQIVEGISSGVYEAVMRAMSNSSTSSSSNVYLDGKKVSTGLESAGRARGKSYGMGGF